MEKVGFQPTVKEYTITCSSRSVAVSASSSFLYSDVPDSSPNNTKS